MKQVKLKRDGQYGNKGSTVEMTDERADQLVKDGAATYVVAKSNRKTVSNKALNAKG